MKSTPEDEQGEEPRPPWHWVGFGVAATFAACVPLQYAAEAAAQRLLVRWTAGATTAEEIATAMASLSSTERGKIWIIAVGLRALPLVISSAFGGWIVGRWGGDNAGVREATIAGAATALVVTGLAFAAMGAGAWWTPALVLVLTTPAATLGGRAGLRARRRAMTPNIR